jgi:hypothetical protein
MPSRVARLAGRRRRGLGKLDRQREAIAATRYRGDGGRPEHLAQRDDLHLQVVLLDHEVRPYALHQLALGYRAIVAVDQRQQHVERAAAELDRRVGVEQLALRGQQAITAEAVLRRGHVRGVRFRGLVRLASRQGPHYPAGAGLTIFKHRRCASARHSRQRRERGARPHCGASICANTSSATWNAELAAGTPA